MFPDIIIPGRAPVCIRLLSDQGLCFALFPGLSQELFRLLLVYTVIAIVCHITFQLPNNIIIKSKNNTYLFNIVRAEHCQLMR